MKQSEVNEVAPLFIVQDVPRTLAFYRDQLGFEITFQGPAEDDIFFGIVRRGGAMVMFKTLDDVDPIPNFGRRPTFSWDAYFDVPDPDALAAEFASRDVAFSSPLTEGDGLRGFVIKDSDGYGLDFGRYRP